MHRRKVLLGLAAATGGLAGCLQSEEDPDDSPEESGDGDQPGAGGTGDDPGAGSSEDEPGETDAVEQSVEDSSIETLGSGCAGSETGDASVDREDGGITVAGTIQASTPCHEAVLEDVTLEDDQLSLTIDVEEDGAGVCTECVGEIEYEATVELSDVDAIQQVNVTHVGGSSMAVGWNSASESSSPETDGNETDG